MAELLAREAEQAEDKVQRALKRASRAALLWPVEAAELHGQGKPLTILPGIGPYLQRVVGAWLDKSPDDAEPPPIRRDFLTLTRARKLLAAHPDWQARYRADLQMHSNWSDGSGTIAQMAEAARQRRYQYIAITDHSHGLKIAGGISEADLREQEEEIQKLNAANTAAAKPLRVLRSIELNLNPQGQGDMEGRALARLDLVVGSFHSKLREKEEQTERYLAALRNRSVHILGHPVGRIYNHRLGLKADWRRVCASAATLDKALEVDSYPDRQDLSLELLRIAKAEGVRIAIDTDAHAPEQLEFVELGLAAALEAAIPAGRIINFMPQRELQAWAKGI